MFLILNIWLIFVIPALSYSSHLARGTDLSENGFLKELQSKQDEYQWKAATYRGITIGKSTAKNIFQKWGKPKRSGHLEGDNPKNPKFRRYDYDAQNEFTGKIRVLVEAKTSKVASITISPDELSMIQAIVLFGKDYIETQYKFCTCDLADAAPIFESPDGNLLYIEYRSRGIAMFVGNQERITSIKFVDKPIGFTSSKECEKILECKPKK